MAHERNTHLSGEDESYFVSMTDLMVGMLFIFIIILMAFALNLQEAEEKITNARETRDEMLDVIKTSLEKRNVKVEIDHESGVLRLKADFLFEKNKDHLTEDGQKDIRNVADVFREVLPCYAQSFKLPCSKPPTTKGGRLEAVFIEGHTDSDPFPKSAGIDNWGLSALRAISTFRALTENQPDLDSISNDSSQHLIGVSGYENRRSTKLGKQADRRIDFRFIMASPKPSPQIETEAALEANTGQ